MCTILNAQGMRYRAVCAGAMVVLALSAGLASAEDYGALHQLGLAEGEAYVAQRDALLSQHPTPWDVGEASAYSWQAGLAAYILNARLAAPDQFAKWEVEVERNAKAAHLPRPGFGLDRTHVNLGFRLEFAWKPPRWVADFHRTSEVTGSQGDRSAFAAARAGALYPNINWSAYLDNDDLCRAIWNGCDIPEFRELAIYNLAAASAPDDQQVGIAALRDASTSLAIRQRALLGFVARDPKEMVDTLVDLTKRADTPTKLTTDAVEYLGMKAREGKAATQAYAALRSIASDVSQLEAVRCAALDACRTDPSAEYVDILQGALRQTELSALQHAAARLAIGRDSLRAALREALYNYGSLDVVTAAAGGLLKGEQKDIDFVRSFIEDPTVPEDARSRASSELHRFEQDQRVRARIEQRRQERLQGDKGP